jgi:hypothetical protein
VRIELEIRAVKPGSPKVLGVLACTSQWNYPLALRLALFPDSNHQFLPLKPTPKPIESAVGSPVKRKPQAPSIRYAARTDEKSPLVPFDWAMAKAHPHSEIAVLYVRQNLSSPGAAHIAPSFPTFFFSLRQDDQQYRMIKGWPRRNEASSAITKGLVAVAWYESSLAARFHDSLYPPFTVLARATHSGAHGPRGILVITGVKDIENWLEEGIVETESDLELLQPGLTQNTQYMRSSWVDLLDGTHVQAKIEIHDASSWSYVVRIDVYKRLLK